MRVELAREAVKLGIDKLPVKAEFVIRPVVVEEALKVPLEPVVE
jgi:ribosomal protein L16/L10AE